MHVGLPDVGTQSAGGVNNRSRQKRIQTQTRIYFVRSLQCSRFHHVEESKDCRGPAVPNYDGKAIGQSLSRAAVKGTGEPRGHWPFLS